MSLVDQNIHVSVNEPTTDNVDDIENPYEVQTGKTEYNVNEDPLYGRKSCIFTDLIAGGVFIAFLLFVIVFGAQYGGKGAVEIWQDNDNFMLKYSVAIAAIAIGFASVWSFFMVLFAKVFINASLVFLIIAQIILAITWTIKLNNSGYSWFWWPAVVFSIGALLLLILMCVIQKQIAFSSALLRGAAKACITHPFVFVFTILLSILKIFFFLITIYAGIGIDANYQLSSGAMGGVWLALAIGMFWVYAVFRGVVQVMTADVVATWARDSSHKPLYAVFAFLKAVSIHLGGVALGSFFVAILEFVNFIITQTARMFASEGNCCAACCMYCLRSIISCIEYMLDVFNKYAYTYMGSLNMSFCSAGREVLEMLRTRGTLAIATDIIIENLLWFGAIVIGAGCAAIGDAFATNNPDLVDNNAALAAMGFFVGYVASMVIFDCIGAGVISVFVLYSRDFTRTRMEIVRPHEYEKLKKSWDFAYPSKTTEQ